MSVQYHEISCGAVVFTRTPEGVKYLLVGGWEGYWGFPKGHMEDGETELETARREIREETGLTVCFAEGFRATDTHSLAREGHPERFKHNVYFLAEYAEQDFIPQETEIARIALMDYGEAVAALQGEGLRRILMEAREFLQTTG